VRTIESVILEVYLNGIEYLNLMGTSP